MMAPTTALYALSPEGVLEDIGNQFELGSAELLDITQAFLEDVKEGLGKYGHPLAMMYVPVFDGVFVDHGSLRII